MLDYSTFIGSNVDTYKFDVFNKIGQSKAGCPVTVKRARNTFKLSPSNPAWSEITDAEYKKISKVDGALTSASSNVAGEFAQLLIEVDLAQLVTTKGSLENLKGLVKSIKVEAYARGEGSFSNQKVTKCNIMLWDNTNKWSDQYAGEANSSDIQKVVTPIATIPESELDTWSQNRITSEGKIYALVSCPNSAGAELPSVATLDYIVIYLDLRRSPDKIQPKQVELGETWSILIKGIAPVALHNSPRAESSVVRTLGLVTQDFKVARADIRISTNNKIGAYFQGQGEGISSIISSAPAVAEEYSTYNILFQNNKGNYTLAIRHKGKTYIDKRTDVPMPIGVYDYGVMQTHGGTQQANSFFDTWEISDHVFSDTELEVILSGRNEKVPNNEYLNSLADIYSNPNLAPNFMDSRWSWSKDIVVSHKQPDIVAFSTVSTYTGSSITFDVIPNTTYEITCDITGDSGHIVWRQLSNSNLITQGVASTVVTSEYTNQLVVALQNREAGNFIFSNLRVRRLD